MKRKFEQKEIDMLYEQLRPDEEVLWRGKPHLSPNYNILTSLILLFLSMITITLLTYYNDMELWFVLSLMVINVSILVYIIVYIIFSIKKIKDDIYCITNIRLVIIDANAAKIQFSKKYNSIKILRLKKMLFNKASIIFDVDFSGEKITDIGFFNIDESEDVLNIINHQLHHMRNK